MNIRNYHIDPKPIGAGTEGEVYRGTDLEKVRVVAIKVIKNHHSFLNQALILNQISFHVNIVSLYDSFEESGLNYLVMDYYPMTLRDFLDCFDPTHIPTRYVKNFAYQICNGLEFIHSHGYAHLDLKPENILFCPDRFSLAISDFGLSRRVDTQLSYSDVQTLNYRAPEILKREIYSLPADIWSFGCIIYEIATGGCKLFPFDFYDPESAARYDDCLISIITLIKDPDLDKLSTSITADTDLFIRWVLNLYQHARPTCRQILNCDYLKIQ